MSTSTDTGMLTALPTSQTSSLERYLAQIPDPALRESISREIAGMGRNFGLVFERHHPEGIKLPKHRVKRGSKVVINTVKDSGYFRVARVFKDEGTALLVDDDGNEATYPLEQLTVAKEFGDVMYPGLKKLSEVRRGTPDAPVHTIINGENYHALEALQYTHAGKVDLIYIDPPYNTGNADWKYNDRYIDSKDGYRHSKWLSFMEKRLLIARRLLSESGVLFMSIDDNEQARLKIMGDQVFGEGNFIGTAINQCASGGGRAKHIVKGHEYLLVYAKDANSMLTLSRRRDSHIVTEFIGGVEYIVDDDVIRKQFGKYDKGVERRCLYEEIAELKGASKKDEIDRRIVAGELMLKPWPGGHVVCKLTPAADARSKIYSIIKSLSKDGKDDLAKIFLADSFDYPKPVEYLKFIIDSINKRDAVVLDFFGGSGTTAEAVIRLNAEDGGTRQAILVTNNELAKADDAALRKAGHAPGDDAYEALGVFHHVTKPRLGTVVTGIRQDGSQYSDGLDANVAFFELTYLDEPEIVTGRALNDLAGLFWLKSGGVGGTVELDAGARAEGFAISESGSTAILFSPGRASTLAEKLVADDQPISHLFIVTDSEAQGDEAASHFSDGITVERIYGSYLEAFQVNRKD